MLTIFMKFLHIITAFWFIAGLIGRTLTMWQASKTADVQTVGILVRLAGCFERLMVIPGSLLLLGSGLLTAWAQHWLVLGTGASYWLLLSTVLYLSMIPVIAFIFIPRGQIFGLALQQAIGLGQITTDLTAAFHDQVVKIAHAYELVGTILIILLMVMKPF